MTLYSVLMFVTIPKQKQEKKTITGLRAAKHGNTCAQDGRVTDWTAVAAYRRRKW